MLPHDPDVVWLKWLTVASGSARNPHRWGLPLGSSVHWDLVAGTAAADVDALKKNTPSHSVDGPSHAVSVPTVTLFSPTLVDNQWSSIIGQIFM